MHCRISIAAMTAQGLGCAKTPALAPHVEISLINCISESQNILHTRGSMPCWRIVFSTFRGCMSFYTGRVIRVIPAIPACPVRPKSGHSANDRVCPRVASFPPPTLGERRHRGLARRLVAMGGRAILVIIVRERPHPRHPHRYSGRFHDAPDRDAIGKHVEIVIVPLAGGARGGGAFEEQLSHGAPVWRYFLAANFAIVRLYRSVAFCSASKAWVVRDSCSMYCEKCGWKVITSRPLFTP